jgi:DNA-binding transcriptional LysR family regulator
MTVQGLEKAIHSLENELGVELFSRDDLGAVIPTIYADEFMKFAENWEFSYRMLHESIERLQAQERLEIRLAASQGIIGLLGFDFLAGFNKKHPDITVTYSEIDDLSCDRALLEGMVELAFCVYPYREGLITSDIATVPLKLWANTKNPLSKKSSLSFADLEQQVLALPGKGYKIYDQFLGRFAELGVAPKSIYCTSEIFRIYEFVVNGQGLGYGSDLLSPVFSSDPNVVTVPLEDVFFRFGISFLAKRQPSSAEQKFLDYCVSYTQTAAWNPSR